MHIREHRSFSLRTSSVHIRDEDPKDVVKSSICGVMMGVLFMIIFAIIGIVGIFTNIEKESEYIWMLVALSLTYILFIPYFILILKDLKRISAELEKHQDESIVMNPFAFASGMNTINAITSNEKYNPFRLLNIQFSIISLILSAYLINSKIVIGSLLAIVNYIVAATILIYACRKCWLGCCNIRVVTKKPKRYIYQRYPSPREVQKTAFAFGILLLAFYVFKGILYIIFLFIQQEDYKFTQLTSLFYSFIICTQIVYVLYLIKKINITLHSKKYFRCYMTLFQSVYLSYTTQNCVLKGLYFFSLLCTYIAFFLEKPYKTIAKDSLFGIQQFCSYEHFIYLFTIMQLIYFFLFRSYCVNKEEEQIQIFDFNLAQPQEQRLQWVQNYQDYPLYKQKSLSNIYQIHDLEALQEIYDNIVFQNSQLELKVKPRSGQLISLLQWIEDKKFQFQLEGKKVDEDYFNNLKQFIEQNVGQRQDNPEKQKLDQDRMECAICLQNLDYKENITQLECHFTHRFHTECIERWILAVHKCPLCNQPT
ncbi:unnamed protein product (macronuclear) [Paramecium tetraurelia]|uniref:RING-type domain-containing protein n=1 Tax=Paramecium tetraurelia TaxID=5888 RepID=A0BHL9_PARTE|nr:uncharacterized protein GSPATT00029071001 [Paramecium tetraurelia]CAK58036.1 unnamed protein product [Paramecium tetraurelia]|eukprot:XP_001425434.1 hypothetical protein (macronuclear) [Paramecium tetraurelia strain d4-2]